MLSKKDLINLEGLFMLYAVKTNDGKVMAAKNMNTSIDTLNKYLEILERELGVKLISLSDRRCALTSYGEKVFVLAEQMINSLRKTYDLKQKEKSLKGEVRIACDRGIKYSLSSLQIEDFYDKYKEITFSIDIFDSLAHINYTDYDLYLCSDFPQDNNLIQLFSKEVDCGFFASKNYLDKHPCPQTIKDILQNHRLVIKRDWLNKFENDIKPLSINTESLCLSNSNVIVYDIVKSCGGIGIIPVNLAQNNSDLIRLEHVDCPLKTKTYLFSKQDSKDIPRTRVVIDYYKKLLNAL